MQLGNSLITDSLLFQFGIYIIQTNFIQFVNCYGNIYNLIRFAYNFSNTGKNLAVVNLNTYTNIETTKNGIDNLHQFHFVQ